MENLAQIKSMLFWQPLFPTRGNGNGKRHFANIVANLIGTIPEWKNISLI
jgi:hypothetical protein